MFTGKAKPIRIFGDPDNQLPDKWNSAVISNIEPEVVHKCQVWL
jgi:hypothetical protein